VIALSVLLYDTLVIRPGAVAAICTLPSKGAFTLRIYDVVRPRINYVCRLMHADKKMATEITFTMSF